MPTREAGLRLAQIDGVVERCPQHHPHDLDAAARELAVGCEALEPPGDVVAIELVETNAAETGTNVAGRSYCRRVLFDTSTLPATHRSTTAATVSRSAPRSPEAANDDAAD